MLTNYFRTDGWVKSTQGAAIPGAQIYVCTQPANIAGLPPSPLASIFSDVNGLVPITQPIITDGFGHYDFYAAAGVYTIVVGLGGVIQQVYPDQSVGGASGTQGGGGGTALAIQVNGTAFSNQLLLNLTGTNSVSVVDAGSGTAQIQGAVFQTNGTSNTLQSKLNLKAGSGVTLTADALGGVSIDAQVAPSASYMFGAGVFGPYAGMSVGYGEPVTDLALRVYAFKFSSSFALNFTKMIFSAASGNGAGEDVAFGMYDSSGNFIWSTTTHVPNTTNQTFTVNINCNVPAGTYYLAWTGSSTVGLLTIWAINLSNFTVDNGTSGRNILNASTVLFGYSGNSATQSGGIGTAITMPSSLGALTAPTSSGQANVPAILFLP